MTRPLAIAHRGASGREVENSLAAFRAAHAMGADAVELDVHATADGAFIVHHDEKVGTLHFTHVLLKEARTLALGNGERVPTLEEALAVITPDMIAFVEVKSLPPVFDQQLFAAIDRCPAPERVQLHAFDHRIIRRLGAARPGLRRGVLSASYPVRPEKMMEDAGATALWEQADLIDPALVEDVHEKGGMVYAWTVDDPNQMRHLLALGVDGLCSNHPDRARHAIDSRNS
ncbi:MAG: glycerophosphodiester phosphodiesterase [Gemmatimonadales bacterium]